MITILDMFEILELPKEEKTEVEQFTPLDQTEESKTDTVETVSKQDYDNLVQTIEELKNLLTNKE